MPATHRLKAQSSTSSGDEHRVIPFRSRRETNRTRRSERQQRPDPIVFLTDRLDSYEQEAPDDFSRRMLMNWLSVAVVLLLLASSVWMVDSVVGL